MNSRGRGSDSKATSADAAVVPTKVTVYPALLSGRKIPDEGIELDVGVAGAVPYIRRHIFKELRTCQFSLRLGKVELADPKASASNLEIQNGANLTIVRITPSEEKRQLWRELVGMHQVWLHPERIEKIGWPCIEQALLETRVGIIDLSGCAVGDVGADIVAKAVYSNPNIKQLWMQRNKITDDGASSLAQGLKNNKNLECIYLGHNRIMDDGAVALAETLKVNKSLKRIELDANGISDVGAKAIAEAIEVNETDIFLNLARNRIGDDGAIAIAKVAGQCCAEQAQRRKTRVVRKWWPRMVLNFDRIYLQGNKIQDAGAVAIAEALKTNRYFGRVDLGNNDISDIGAVAIAKAIQTNTRVECVLMHGNIYGVVGRNALRQAEKNREKQRKPLHGFSF